MFTSWRVFFVVWAMALAAAFWATGSRADCVTDWIATDAPGVLNYGGYPCSAYAGGCTEQVVGTEGYAVAAGFALYACDLSATPPPPPTSGPASDGSTGCVAGVQTGWMSNAVALGNAIQIEIGGCVFDLQSSGYDSSGTDEGGLAASTGQATGTGAGGGGGGTSGTGGNAPAATLVPSTVTGSVSQDTTTGLSSVQDLSSVQQTVGTGASAVQVTTTCASGSTLSGVTCVATVGSGSLSGVSAVPNASVLPGAGGTGGGTLSGVISDPALLSMVTGMAAFDSDATGLSSVAPPGLTQHTLSDISGSLLDSSFAPLLSWVLPERTVACPTWNYSFSIYGTTFAGVYDAQCTIWAAVGDTVSAISLLAWALCALFIVLSA